MRIERSHLLLSLGALLCGLLGSTPAWAQAGYTIPALAHPCEHACANAPDGKLAACLQANPAVCGRASAAPTCGPTSGSSLLACTQACPADNAAFWSCAQLLAGQRYPRIAGTTVASPVGQRLRRCFDRRRYPGVPRHLPVYRAMVQRCIEIEEAPTCASLNSEPRRRECVALRCPRGTPACLAQQLQNPIFDLAGAMKSEASKLAAMGCSGVLSALGVRPEVLLRGKRHTQAASCAIEAVKGAICAIPEVLLGIVSGITAIPEALQRYASSCKNGLTCMLGQWIKAGVAQVRQGLAALSTLDLTDEKQLGVLCYVGGSVIASLLLPVPGTGMNGAAQAAQAIRTAANTVRRGARLAVDLTGKGAALARSGIAAAGRALASARRNGTRLAIAATRAGVAAARSVGSWLVRTKVMISIWVKFGYSPWQLAKAHRICRELGVVARFRPRSFRAWALRMRGYLAKWKELKMKTGDNVDRLLYQAMAKRLGWSKVPEVRGRVLYYAPTLQDLEAVIGNPRRGFSAEAAQARWDARVKEYVRYKDDIEKLKKGITDASGVRKQIEIREGVIYRKGTRQAFTSDHDGYDIRSADMKGRAFQTLEEEEVLLRRLKKEAKLDIEHGVHQSWPVDSKASPAQRWLEQDIHESIINGHQTDKPVITIGPNGVSYEIDRLTPLDRPHTFWQRLRALIGRALAMRLAR